jgi:type II secretory pathway pseudopilin PulG
MGQMAKQAGRAPGGGGGGGTRCRAFTLVDALVSFVILALLAGLILPGLLGSREAARRTACITNLKTWGLGAHLYRLDHQDLLPLAPERAQATRSDPRFGRLQDVFDPYLAVPEPVIAPGGLGYALTLPWHCPSETGAAPLGMSSYGYRPGWFMFNLLPYNPVAAQLVVSRLAWVAPGTKVMFEDYHALHARSIENPGGSVGGGGGSAGANMWRSGVFDDGRVDWIAGTPVWFQPAPDPMVEYPSSIHP